MTAGRPPAAYLSRPTPQSPLKPIDIAPVFNNNRDSETDAMRPFFRQALLGTVVVILCSPASGQAALLEWGPEGSYVHQMAHLLFFGSLLFFIREMYRGGLQTARGFRCLIWACWLLALWNLEALFGHIIDWSLHNPLILGEGMSRRLVMENTHTWLFYITKLNHFLLLPPAFYLLYRGLKILTREFQGGRL